MIIVIGGGPAGFFAAITAKQHAPDQEVLLLEKGSEVLRKVTVSGGGRCNVTHHCPEPKTLAEHYPRGGKALRGPFHSWGTDDTRQWFEDLGVRLKTEADGRVFPESNSSSTIVGCLRTRAHEVGVVVETGELVQSLVQGATLEVQLKSGRQLSATAVLLATGGHGHQLAAQMGHTIVSPVPSLFTFNCIEPMLEDMAGVAAQNVSVRATGPGLPRKGLEQGGPLLITHWGLSGPAVLKLSAWGARLLSVCNYQFVLRVDWCPDIARDDLDKRLNLWATENGQKQTINSCPVEMPRRLWTAIVKNSGVPEERRWAELGRKMLARLLENLKGTPLEIDGKSTFKEEFVTCGGVKLSEVNFKTMESKICPGLFFAGEVLDIDGVTGGFNFQGCWTTGRLAGLGMANAEK